MKRDAEFEDVRRRMDEFGPRASLVTVTDEGTPHVVSVLVGLEGERLTVDVGSRSQSNLTDKPNVTLVWFPPAGGNYQMIVDGSAAQIGEPNDDGLATVSIEVTRGILHRLAGLEGSGPTCIALSAPRSSVPAN
jgi:Pyridoxamine 5'-phosphate oxidase